MNNISPIDAPVTGPGDAAEASAASVHYRVGDPAPRPLKPFTEPELIAMWGGKTEPLVSILCPTYNHREFIADALDGFLGQVTDFPFEVIVRDDASTDGTADIVRAYAARYPTVIRPLLESHNTFSQGVSFIPPLAMAARGSLIGLCAGDDYWTCVDKLASQKRFLDAHPSASMVAHREMWIEDGRVLSDEATDSPGSTTCSWEYRGPGPFPFVNTWMFRRLAADLVAPEFNQIVQEDNLIHAQLRVAGPIGVLVDRVMTARRRHSTQMWSAQSDMFRQFHCFQTHLWMSEYFFRVGRRAEGRHYALCAAGDVHNRFLASQSRSTRRWTSAWMAIYPLRRIFARLLGRR